MGGLKTKGRGKDKRKRKPRKGMATKSVESETVKPDILRNIINAISEKVKKPEYEPWSLDIGPRVEVPILGRHVFKSDKTIEIDLEKL